MKNNVSLNRLWYLENKTHVFFESDYTTYSDRAVDIIISTIQKILKKKKYAIFVPSSGKSPQKIYDILLQKYSKTVDWTRVIVVQMDEYWNMSCKDVNSMSLFIEQKLVIPLNIKKYIHFFDDYGRLIRSLDEYEKLIDEMGCIDLVVHGIGQNGHIGFNEPYSDWSSKVRKVTLTNSTLEANFNKKNIKDIEIFREGVTIGINMLKQATHAILLISGYKKNTIVKKIFSQSPSEEIPASSLSLNTNVNIIVDGDSILINNR